MRRKPHCPFHTSAVARGRRPQGARRARLSFVVTRLPVRGTLRQLSGEPLLAGVNIQARAPAGGGRQVRFVPPSTRGFGPNYDSFDFAVRDSQGLQSAADATVTINVPVLCTEEGHTAGTRSTIVWTCRRPRRCARPPSPDSPRTRTDSCSCCRRARAESESTSPPRRPPSSSTAT